MRVRVTLAVSLWVLAGAATVSADGAGCPSGQMPGLQAAWGRHQAALATLRAPTGPSSRRSPGGGMGESWNQAVEAAAWSDFSRVASAILGQAPAGDEVLVGRVASALATGTPLPIACHPAVTGRDRLARRLIAAGYSAREIADILTGRLSKRELDHACRLLMAGYGDRRVAAYLDRVMASRAAQRDERTATPGGVRTPLTAARPLMARMPANWDRALMQHAAAHRLDPSLVRAVVAAESAGDHTAVSPAGAIGLMQLMPATARMLGVDPYDPIENLRGGVTYLAGLLRAFGDVKLALIAYNAGPSHAERVRRGEATPYGGTRRYLQTIARSYPLAH